MRAVRPHVIVQTRVVHLLRNSFRHAARQDREGRASQTLKVCTDWAVPADMGSSGRVLRRYLVGGVWGRLEVWREG